MIPSWKERLAEGRLVPYFQPIVSLESLDVAAYEALGRHQVDGEVHSLGPFFEAGGREPGLASLRKEVDRGLRRAALEAFASWSDQQSRLFLNVNPKLMAEHLRLAPGELPWTLKVIDELGLSPSRVVIELTEEAIDVETSSLRKLVDLYRSYGCGIAVDDVGAKSSNLDRIGYFEPDIIKVDAAILRRSLEHRSFRQVLKGVSAMAEGLGASLLFEGVETEDDLAQALSFGARYAQGWYFAAAGPQPRPRDGFALALAPVLRSLGRSALAADEACRHRLRDVVEGLGRPPAPTLFPDGSWGFDPADLEFWGRNACRVFLTDREGFQVSPNYEPSATGWRADRRFLGWSRLMRPYFPGGGDARWSISPPYFDVNDRVLMRTYSRPAGPQLILFVDVLEIENPSRSD